MKKITGLCVSLVSLMSLAACGNTFIDARDNQVYRMVTIGNQTWMAQNLNYRYEQQANGDSSSYFYNNNPDSCSKYGRFYLRDAAMDFFGQAPGNKTLDFSPDGSCRVSGNVRGACPEGWHLPSKAEWDTLVAFVGGPKMAAKRLRATVGWDNNGNQACGNGEDRYLFTALPAGIGIVHHWDDPPRETIKSLYSSAQGQLTFFWSSTDIDDSRTYFKAFSACDEDSTFTSSDRLSGMQQAAYHFSLAISIRCIRDETIPSLLSK